MISAEKARKETKKRESLLLQNSIIELENLAEAYVLQGISEGKYRATFELYLKDRWRYLKKEHLNDFIERMTKQGYTIGIREIQENGSPYKIWQIKIIWEEED